MPALPSPHPHAAHLSHRPRPPQVDMEGGGASLWRPGPQRFMLEPKFAPRPGGTAEDDGWLLSLQFHSGACAGRGGQPACLPCHDCHSPLSSPLSFSFSALAGTGKCSLLILDAQQLEQGPVATLRFREVGGFCMLLSPAAKA